jgi:hypothetical protein
MGVTGREILIRTAKLTQAVISGVPADGIAQSGTRVRRSDPVTEPGPNSVGHSGGDAPAAEVQSRYLMSSTSLPISL